MKTLVSIVISAVVFGCGESTTEAGTTTSDASGVTGTEDTGSPEGGADSEEDDTGPASSDAHSRPELDASADGQDGEDRDVASADDTGPLEDTNAPEDVVQIDVAKPAKDTSPPEDLSEAPGPVFTEPPTAAACFESQLGATGVPLIDYDQFAPVLGLTCKGTRHQEIEGVERVVFAGDSITVGTPPTDTAAWYRNVMAVELAAKFGLTAPDWAWQNVDLLNGVSYTLDTGDFASCAKWGARTDDLTEMPHQQFITCNPPEQREKRTLLVLTAGGNDLFSWAQDLVKGVPIADLWKEAELAVHDLEVSIHWAVDDPTTFPNGVYVVFANTFEFTDVDSGNDLATCPGANIISMDTALVDPEFSKMAAWMAEQYMRIAVETGTDMVFLGEHFCGHGYMYDKPEGRCYRKNAKLWLDITCMHPGAPGHAGIADLFMSVIDP